MEQAYVTALARTLSQEGVSEERVVDGLVAHLKARGRLKLLPRIAAALTKSMKRDALRAPRIEIAGEAYRASAEAAARESGTGTETVAVNTTLLSGFRIQSGTRLTDRSGKRALIDLYRSITNA